MRRNYEDYTGIKFEDGSYHHNYFYQEFQRLQMEFANDYILSDIYKAVSCICCFCAHKAREVFIGELINTTEGKLLKEINDIRSTYKPTFSGTIKMLFFNKRLAKLERLLKSSQEWSKKRDQHIAYKLYINHEIYHKWHT